MTGLRRFVIFALLMVLALNAGAQRPAYYKMSGLVRNFCREAVGPALVKHAQVKNSSSIIAFVKLNDGNVDALTERHCKVLAQFGNLFIADIPSSAIVGLSLDNSVSRIEAGQRATAMMDTTAEVINAVPVQEGIDLPQGYTGNGVVVGVQDIGFDLTHPNFWNSSMTAYRIKAMWDQLSVDTIGSILPVGRDYVGEEELLGIQHPRDGILQTHGTHTTGIAAGSGAEGNGVVSPYKGIAYDADICLVCNATSDDASIIDVKDYYKYTYATDALGFKYIFDYADRVGKPCVINFSEGSSMDFRGDDQLYYEMLDSLTGPGHIIVSSAGNNGLTLSYVHKGSTQTSKTIACHRGSIYSLVTTRSSANGILSIKLSNGSQSMSVDISLSKVLLSPDSVYTDSIVGNGIRNTVVATAYRSCYNPSDIICDWQVNRDTVNMTEDAKWKLSFELKGDDDIEMFPVIGTLYHEDGSGLGDEENYYSVNSPSSAPSVISVGMTGYRTSITNYLDEILHPSVNDVAEGQRNINSSVGPTFDERVKPDVMAPGQNVISSYSSFYEESNPTARDIHYDVRHFDYNGRTYAWNSNTGTSMSSPVVAGVIALWLQACPTLTPDDCIEIFSKTCSHYDSTLPYPNNYYGYGQIDAKAGMNLVLQKAAAGIDDVPAYVEPSNRIYTIDGRYVGSDASSLPHGIYISNGKKFIK